MGFQFFQVFFFLLCSFFRLPIFTLKVTKNKLCSGVSSREYTYVYTQENGKNVIENSWKNINFKDNRLICLILSMYKKKTEIKLPFLKENEEWEGRNGNVYNGHTYTHTQKDKKWRNPVQFYENFIEFRFDLFFYMPCQRVPLKKIFFTKL